jgi:hypothetical protein
MAAEPRTIAELSRALRTRQLTALSVTERCLQAIAEHRWLNAFISVLLTRSAISITVALLSCSTMFALSNAILPFVSSSPAATDGLSSPPAKPTIYVVVVFSPFIG